MQPIRPSDSLPPMQISFSLMPVGKDLLTDGITSPFSARFTSIANLFLRKISFVYATHGSFDSDDDPQIL